MAWGGGLSISGFSEFVSLLFVALASGYRVMVSGLRVEDLNYRIE